MEIRRVTFAEPFPEPHLSIDCWPPFPDLNMLFAAAAKAFVDPYTLAAQMGKISEESAIMVQAQAYAEGVVANSQTEGYEAYGVREWLAFFLEHPDHFDELRRHLEVRRNWDDPTEAQHGGARGS